MIAARRADVALAVALILILAAAFLMIAGPVAEVPAPGDAPGKVARR